MTDDQQLVTLDQLRDALRCGRPNCSCSRQNSRNYHCPTHDDATPSFTVTLGADGKALVNCKKGCTQERTIGELVRKRLWPIEGSASHRAPNQPRRRTLTQSWPLVDPSTGDVVAHHERWDYVDRDENGELGKEFLWRDGATGKPGLNGKPVADLPLYGIELIDEEPDELVWVVEGEKASDAANNAGLISVSLVGGASQTNFGRQLDILRERDVVLWADNDDVGRALMTRVATILPDAKMVRPPGQLEHDDAFDYFNRGSTVDDLMKLLKDPQPEARLLRDGVEVTYPKPVGTVTFLFQQMIPGQNKLRSFCHVTHDIPGRETAPFHSRLDLTSISNKEIFARELRRMYGVKDDAINWTVALNIACQAAEEAYMNRAHAVSLDQVDEMTTEQYLIRGFFPLDQMTMIFADGGSGKTYICILAAICALTGEPFLGHAVDQRVENVMFIDYESTETVFRKRFRRVCEGLGIEPGSLMSRFHYYDANGIALEHQVRQIRQEMNRTKSKLIFVDSAAPASGGHPEDAEGALGVFNSLGAIGDVTKVVIAHNTKEGQDDKPFGSVFWHNNARMTHMIRGEQPPGGGYLHCGIFNRKANDDAMQDPFGFNIRFDGQDGQDGPVTFEKVSRTPAKKIGRKKGIRQAVMETLRANDEWMTTADIHLALEADSVATSKGAVSNVLKKGEDDDLFTSRTVMREKQWMLARTHAASLEAVIDDEPLPAEPPQGDFNEEMRGAFDD